MTAAALLGWITAALPLQVGAGASVAIWRWRHATPTAPSGAETRPQAKPDAAWAGWRDFRVARREYKDAAHSQCSFYLEPVEHRPDKVRAEHIEEGIREFENCVECHRSAKDEPKRPGSSRDERRKRD